ncbi:uncharacterized protein LOC144645359 [Oculina patagonica]
MQFDSDWEETLNDIDELIQSELGCTQVFHGGTQLFGQAEVQELSAHMQPVADASLTEWHFPGASNETLRQLYENNIAINPEPQNKDPEVNIEVQIMDLKDFYDKKTKKGAKGLEYRLENSEVTVVARASVEVINVYAHVQRCARAAIRTHDTSGPVELEVSTLQREKKRRVICVDLGSVYKKQDGDHVYWLERADVAERNKWELTITIELISGLTASVTSRPFRVTTKVNYKRSADYSSACRVQNLSCKITAPQSRQAITDTGVTPLRENRERKKGKLLNSKVMENDIVCNELSQDLLQCNLAEIDETSLEDPFAGNIQCEPNSVEQERIILQPNTVLERHLVASYYNREPRVRCVVEQPELPALLKLVGKRSMLVSNRQKKTKRKKAADETFWWACGHCFFERRKKSTIKAHLIQGVCRKPRRLSKRIHSGSELERRLRSSSETSELDKYKPDSWKRSLSV